MAITRKDANTVNHRPRITWIGEECVVLVGASVTILLIFVDLE